MTRRRVGVLTSTRADYGLLVPALRAIVDHDGLELRLFVTGTHLSERFGHTVDAIEADGFAIASRIDALQPGDDVRSTAGTMAATLSGVAAALAEHRPDVLVLLGDRYEILAAAAAATIAGVPIAHVHGGELTHGAFDDALRHAITKLAQLHFAAAEAYRQRIVQMGEDPEAVITVGALAADNVRALDLLDRAALEVELGHPLDPPLLVVTHHPVTLAADRGLSEIQALITALQSRPDVTVVFTGVNADPGHEALESVVRTFVEGRPGRASLHPSLGRLRYLSLVNVADAVVGNSSSGVIEAPILGTPTVNVGTRQEGRLRPSTVLDCEPSATAIAAALDRALSMDRTGGDSEAAHPFGDGFTGQRIAEILATADLDALRRTPFRDVAPTLPPAPRPVYVIAEVGVNHNGSLETAKTLVDAAADAGADAVKFQSFRADALVTAAASRARYQADRTGSEGSQREMLRALELDEDQQRELADHCRSRGVEFLSTPFDLDSLAFLADGIGLRTIKVGSGDLTNAPLLLDVARRRRRVILSTGMATMDENERALGVLAFGYTDTRGAPGRDAFARAFRSPMGRAALRDHVVLLHCTTAYPTPPSDVNLRAMDSLHARFGLPVGFSDHSEGPVAAVAAVARGACVVEKHVTLDRSMAGPDHAASMEPRPFADLVAALRDVERALGEGGKGLAASEVENVPAARKSLVAARPIREGEIFTMESLTVKRPGDGISALDYFEWVGRAASRDFAPDEPIS